MTAATGLGVSGPCGATSHRSAGVANGLEQSSAVACDHITMIPVGNLGRQIGRLFDHQEDALTHAIRAAFDLV